MSLRLFSGRRALAPWVGQRGCANAPAARAVSREEAMSRWGIAAATGLPAIPSALSGLATMDRGGIRWAVHEKMDFFLEFQAPAPWDVNIRVRENFAAIQCVPPGVAAPRVQPSPQPRGAAAAGQRGSAIIREAGLRGEILGGSAEDGNDNRDASSPSQPVAEATPTASSRPSVHGLSITSFAYPRKVANTDADVLLRNFLGQFRRSVQGPVAVVGATSSPDLVPVDCATPGAVRERSVELLQQAAHNFGGALCELTFTPPMTGVDARAYCRAFFHPNRRFHYVAVFAVPDDEWAVVADTVLDAVAHASPCGGDLAAKMMPV